MSGRALLAESPIPHLIWTTPFVALLLGIAVLPILPRTEKWWHRNMNKFWVAAFAAAATLAYYGLRGFGISIDGHNVRAGWPSVAAILGHAVLGEYVPFMAMLFALYMVAGGICIKGDRPAHPLTNTLFLAVGSVLASILGTTGASMLLIRPLLRTNSERTHVVHTVVFFIFLVSNIGGTLLPIGDPPLFLGYLRGMPFLWTLRLWKPWLFCVVVLLLVYYLLDRHYWYKREPKAAIARDETETSRIQVLGGFNLGIILCAVLAIALLDPSRTIPGTGFFPPRFLREAVLLALVGISGWLTPREVYRTNEFTFTPILEVACIFIGIFICMQVPVEILHARGASLGLSDAPSFFWATGLLSSILDNAPTFIVFFETASSLSTSSSAGVLSLSSGNFISESLLTAICLGAVFMGANTYIGNGPNFMVKSIADHSGIKMPSFFRYMGYSVCVLLPLFVLVQLFFL